MLDLHCHTELSFDSEAKLEDYHKMHNIERFCQTEHYEFEPEDQKYNFAEVTSELKGIELGYNENYIEEIRRLISEQNFDVVLLSHHQIRQYCTDEINRVFDVESYLKGLIKMFNQDINYDIFTHIDYPFRYYNVSLQDVIDNEQLLNECLRTFIKTNKYLELNTSSIYHYETEELTKYIFEHYYKLGGRKISLGSDCHTVERYNFNFDLVLKYLEDYSDIEILNFII